MLRWICEYFVGNARSDLYNPVERDYMESNDTSGYNIDMIIV